MGCQMLALVERDSDVQPDSLADVSDWFEEWEQSLSRFRYDSELSRLNRTTDQPVRVSQTLWDVFQASLVADRTTGGLVTPTVLEAMELAGYDRPFEEIRGDLGYIGLYAQIQPLSLVVTDKRRCTICLPANIRLDFGGVAKGWAAHQAVERLKSSGPTLMNAGGDIAISGPRLNHEPWLVGIANPFSPGEDLATLHLYGSGVATSGKDRRRWMQGGLLNHHIIDPRTGQSALTDILTVTVIAPTAMEAEAAAKAVFLQGSDAGLEWLEADSGLAGVLVLDNGQVIASSQAEKYL